MDISLSLDSETLKAYEAYLCLQKNRSAHTVKAYLQTLTSLATFAKAFDGTNAITIMRDFTKDAAAVTSKATQAQRSSALRNFINWMPNLNSAQKAALLKYIQSPKIPKRVPRILDLADIQKILTYIESQNTAEQVVFHLLYGSGLRISEALSASWNNANLSERSLKVMGKGSKERIVPMTMQLAALLKNEKSKSGKESSLVPGQPDENLVRKWVRRWGSDLELEDKNGRWHPHKLRHSIASHLLQMGAKVPQIQKLLGHEQLSTTEKYTHLNPSDLLRVYKSSMPLK